MTIQAINPSNGKNLRTYESLTVAEIEDKISTAHEAFLAWRETSFRHRAAKLTNAARILRDNADGYANLMATEMGKPIRDGRAEIEKCAWVCEYYAEHAEAFLAPEEIESDASRSFVTYQPLGVILAVMPWNYPFWQVFRFAAPTLMAGNTCLLKHASNVPGCSQVIEQIFREADCEEGIFQSLLIPGKDVERVLANPYVQGVSLTGSTAAGKKVAALAGTYLKKSVLELGGSDPYVILEDADVKEAAELCAKSRLLNAGQSCISAKRMIVVEAVRREFEEHFLRAMNAQTMGDPMEEETELGPMAREDLREELHQQVRKSIQAGAHRVCGGDLPKGPGAFYPPTILTQVKPGMPAYDEELFGPVAAIIPVKDEAEAIEVANDTSFGLGAAVFTKDIERGTRIASEQLHAGCCFVNDFVKSDPRLPFGGVKESGYGRELSSHGIKEFTNVKTVLIK